MKVPRLQILTAAQILDGRLPKVPFGFTEGFKEAEREKVEAGEPALVRLLGLLGALRGRRFRELLHKRLEVLGIIVGPEFANCFLEALGLRGLVRISCACHPASPTGGT